MSSDQRRRQAHLALDALLDEFERVERTNGIEREVAGRAALFKAARFVGHLCRPETLSRVYGFVPASAERAEKLQCLAGRLSVAAGIFSSVRTGDGAEIPDAFYEVRAIAAGDVPILFDRTSSNKKTSVRVAQAKLRAVAWSAYLESAEVECGKREQAIAEAFGRPWDSIRRKWQEDAEAALGASRVRLALHDAVCAGRPDGRGKYAEWLFDPRDWKRELTRDGRIFQEEVRSKAARGIPDKIRN